MKKLLSVILATLLVLSSFATVAFAAGTATITVSNATAKAGDTVSLSFTLDGDQFAGYGMYITTDSALSVDSVEQGPASKGIFFFNPKKDNIVTNSNVVNGKGGVLFTAKIKVAGNATPGKYPVSVRIDNVADENGKVLDVTVVKGYVTVECSQHTWGEWKTDKAPSCTGTGTAKRTCSACGETESKTLPVTEHTWGEWKTVEAASCTKDGKAERTCSVCGETETKTLTAAGSHSWGEWTTVAEPTCTVDGKAQRTCSKCGEVETKVLPATNVHIWGEWTTVTEPTCTVDGKAERACSTCGKTESKTLPATNVHVYGDWNVVKAATCTDDGKAERSCACGKTESKTIAATGHNWSDWATVAEPSCTVDGKAERTCSKCGEVETKVLPSANAHAWGEWVTVTEPTCTEDGEAKRTCSKCGEVETKVLPSAEAHTWGEWVTITEPSCTADGKAERTCSKCGEVETKVLPSAEAHTWGELKVITEPTCTEAGKAEHTCSKCGEVETVAIEAIGHKISDKWLSDGTNHWHVCDNDCGELFDMDKHDLKWVITKNPGQTAPGLKHQECKVCGFVGEDVEIPADPDLDDVPQTDDHTMMMTVSLIAVLSVLLVAAYLTKRKYIR